MKTIIFILSFIFFHLQGGWIIAQQILENPSAREEKTLTSMLQLPIPENPSDERADQSARGLVTPVPQLDLEGNALGTRLARLKALNLDASNDVLEILMPEGGGQFIECQVGTNIRFQVNDDGSVYSKNSVNVGGNLLLVDEGNHSSAEIIMEDNSDNQTIVLRAKDGVSDTGGEILLRGGSTNGVTVELDGNWGGSERGRIRTHELEIEGGADIAENFDLKISDQNIYQAGMLVSIDPKDPGKLHLTREAYDPKVAGVISGANGVRPGLFIGQKNSFADGDFPIALVGRVYMLADASFGAIKPGDLLTSSPVQGYAMKVRRYKKARGAIVGKSMTRLDEGQGYVLALVNLQ